MIINLLFALFLIFIGAGAGVLCFALVVGGAQYEKELKAYNKGYRDGYRFGSAEDGRVGEIVMNELRKKKVERK